VCRAGWTRNCPAMATAPIGTGRTRAWRDGATNARDNDIAWRRGQPRRSRWVAEESWRFQVASWALRRRGSRMPRKINKANYAFARLSMGPQGPSQTPSAFAREGACT
jgi:hypothetical protein